MHEVQPDSRETEDLLRQVRAGDRQAFEQLFTRHQAYLRRLVELRLDPRLPADEQEACRQFWADVETLLGRAASAR
jgi:hypothetical protein